MTPGDRKARAVNRPRIASRVEVFARDRERRCGNRSSLGETRLPTRRPATTRREALVELVECHAHRVTVCGGHRAVDHDVAALRFGRELGRGHVAGGVGEVGRRALIGMPISTRRAPPLATPARAGRPPASPLEPREERQRRADVSREPAAFYWFMSDMSNVLICYWPDAGNPDRLRATRPRYFRDAGAGTPAAIGRCDTTFLCRTDRWVRASAGDALVRFTLAAPHRIVFDFAQPPRPDRT